MSEAEPMSAAREINVSNDKLDNKTSLEVIISYRDAVLWFSML